MLKFGDLTQSKALTAQNTSCLSQTTVLDIRGVRVSTTNTNSWRCSNPWSNSSRKRTTSPFDAAAWTMSSKTDQSVDGVTLMPLRESTLSHMRTTKMGSLKEPIAPYAKRRRPWYKRHPSRDRSRGSFQKREPSFYVCPVFQRTFGQKLYSILSG